MIERLYYPLAGLSVRWGCSVSDILQLGIQDRAQICANIYGLQRGRYEIRTDDGEADSGDIPMDELPETDYPEYDPTDVEKARAEADWERWKSRTKRDMPSGIFELDIETIRFLDMPGAFPFTLHSAMKFKDGEWAEYDFQDGVSINEGHLCMLHDEVCRLDADFFNTAPQVGTDKPLSTRERNTLLSIIAVLCKEVSGWSTHLAALVH